MKIKARLKNIYRKIVKTELEKKISNPNKDGFFVLQIGACDGISFDPINHLIEKYNWGGVLIEPVPHHFKNLKETYKGNQSIKLLNTAIGNHSGLVPFFTIDEKGLKELPHWAIGISSLGNDKNSLSKEYWDNREKTETNERYFKLIEKHLVKINVNCITFSELVKNEKIKKIDLLQIDAEGYDFEIIKSINFDVIKPKMIHFEIASLKGDEKNICINYLKKNGYSIDQYNGNDAFALMK